jgi:hypothetical protein
VELVREREEDPDVAHLHLIKISDELRAKIILADDASGPHSRGMSARTWLLVALLSPALTACRDYRQCAPPDPSALDALPTRLSETGLFADLASDTLGPGVRAYAPSFELWSDGAEKRRWIRLPEGSTIDTSDMNAWRFPVGTRVWKEFTRDGVRVETRMLERIGEADDAWIGVAYVWDALGTDAIQTPEGLTDALGTEHDVPAADRCMGCHGGRRSVVLGFSAIQLAHEATGDAWALDDLVAEGVLTDAPTRDIIVPGDETERAALGLLHANCGHCHSSARPQSGGPRCFDPENPLDFWLRVEELDTAEGTSTYRSAIGSVIRRGDPDGSQLFQLASQRGEGRQMPPLATERTDPRATEILRAWISGL